MGGLPGQQLLDAGGGGDPVGDGGPVQEGVAHGDTRPAQHQEAAGQGQPVPGAVDHGLHGEPDTERQRGDRHEVQQPPGQRSELSAELIPAEPPQEAGPRARVGHTRVGIRKVLNLHDVPVDLVQAGRGMRDRGARRHTASGVRQQTVKGSRRSVLGSKRFPCRESEPAFTHQGRDVRDLTRWHGMRCDHGPMQSGGTRRATVAMAALGSLLTMTTLSACGSAHTGHPGGTEGRPGAKATQPKPAVSPSAPTRIPDVGDRLQRAVPSDTTQVLTVYGDGKDSRTPPPSCSPRTARPGSGPPTGPRTTASGAGPPTTTSVTNAARSACSR